ncbi:hypothetical protein FXW78_33075 [Rhodococcus opacus]|nr:hypothetical protein [Rhodococcus opacus]
MTERAITVAVGTAVLVDGDAAQIVEFDGRKVVISYADGRFSTRTSVEQPSGSSRTMPGRRHPIPAGVSTLTVSVTDE